MYYKSLMTSVLVFVSMGCASGVVTFSAPGATVPVMLASQQKETKTKLTAQNVNIFVPGSESTTTSGPVTTTRRTATVIVRSNCGPKEISAQINEQAKGKTMHISTFRFRNWWMIGAGWWFQATLSSDTPDVLFEDAGDAPHCPPKTTPKESEVTQ